MDLGPVLFGDLNGAVGRAGVHDDDLPGGVAHGSEAAAEEFFLILDNHANRKARSAVGIEVETPDRRRQRRGGAVEAAIGPLPGSGPAWRQYSGPLRPPAGGGAVAGGFGDLRQQQETLGMIRTDLKGRDGLLPGRRDVFLCQ